jgi:hypothetical protein
MKGATHLEEEGLNGRDLGESSFSVSVPSCSKNLHLRQSASICGQFRIRLRLAALGNPRLNCFACEFTALGFFARFD